MNDALARFLDLGYVLDPQGVREIRRLLAQVRPKVISHRGNGFGRPENSMAAFRRAVHAPIHGIEIDVRISKDEIPVLSHDPTVNGTRGQERRIAANRFAQLPEEVPTLYEVLAVVTPTLKVDVEIKPGLGSLEPIFELLEGRQGIRISSFDWEILEEARRRLPRIPRALLVPPRTRTATVLAAAERLGVRGVHLTLEQARPDLVEALRELRQPLRLYTLNSARSWARAQQLSADGIFTDRPLELVFWLLRRILGQRGGASTVDTDRRSGGE